MVTWKALNATMLLLFVTSVVVQINDPDPATWMLIYGLAAIACALELVRRLRWWFPATVAGIALVWAVTIAPRVVGRVPFLDMFAEWEMQNTGVEESREMYGLLIVEAWMVALLVANWRSPRRK